MGRRGCLETQFRYSLGSGFLLTHTHTHVHGKVEPIMSFATVLGASHGYFSSFIFTTTYKVPSSRYTILGS